MDFKSMMRKELQALCKKHGLAANSTNSQMIASLSSILENEEKNKRKGFLKGSARSNGEGDSKKVSFVIEDEEEEGFEEFRRKPVGKSKKNLIKRRSVVAPELEKSSAERPKNVTGIQRSSTRSRGLAEAVVRSPVIEKRKKNLRDGTEGVRGNDNPIPTARALRNRVVTVENPRTTQNKKGSDKKEESEKAMALLVEDEAVGRRNLRKRSRDEYLIEDKAAPRKPGRNNAKVEESVATEEVDVGRSKKRRKGDAEVLDGGGAAKRSNANTLVSRDVKAQGQGKTRASKRGGDSADITSDNVVVAVATRRSTRSSSAVEKSNEEGEAIGKAKLIKQAKGHSVEVAAEPVRRSTCSSSTLFEDEKSIKGGKPVKSLKQAKGRGDLTTSLPDVEVPIGRSTHSSSSLLDNGTCIPVVGKPVNRKRGVSTAFLADSKAAAEPTRRWTRNSSKLSEVDAHLPSAGKLDSGAEAIRNDKRRKQPKALASKTADSTVILTMKEEVTMPTRRSTRSSLKLSEVESLLEVETLGNDNEVGKGKSGKESKKPASKMGNAIAPVSDDATLTSPARRSTHNSSKVMEDGIVLEAGKLSRENESVTKEKSSKKSKEYALKDGSSSKLVSGSPAVSESISRSTHSSSKLLEDGILVEAKKMGDHNKTVSKEKSGLKKKNSVLKDGDSTKSVVGSPAVTVSTRGSSRSSSKLLEDGNLLEAEKLGKVNEAVHKNKSGKKVKVSTSKDGDSLAFVSSSPAITESNRRSTRSSLKHNMLKAETPLSVPAKLGDVNEAAHEQHKELPRRSTRSASKHDASCISVFLLGKGEKKRTRDTVSKEDEIVREVGRKGTMKASPTSSPRKSPRLCAPHTGSKLSEGIQNDSHMKGKSSLGKKHMNKQSSHMHEEQDVQGGNEVQASKPFGLIAIAEITSQGSLEETVSNIDATMESERTSESQNITTPLAPLERLEEVPASFDTEISTVAYFKGPDSANEADIEHVETIHISSPQFPCKSSEKVSLIADLEASSQIDLEGPSMEIEINREAADAGGSTLVCKSSEQGVYLQSDNDSKLVADVPSNVATAGDVVTADNEATTIIDPVLSDTEVCTKTFFDLVIEELNLKMATNTAGTPLSSKSTNVEIPAMNKESSSDNFLIEPCDSCNTLEVPLTVDRDAGDLSSIQRLFDSEMENCNADTDTLLRDQIARGECDAVKKFKSPHGDSYSQLYESCPETIKETWVSSSPLVALKDNIETSDGMNDPEVNEDELRPSSPNDHLKEPPIQSSSKDVVAELQSDFTENMYDKDTADAEENLKDAFMEPDHTSPIRSLDAISKPVNQMEKEDRLSEVDDEYTGFSSFANDNRSLADANFLEDKKVIEEVDLPTLPVSFTCEENLLISSTEAPVSREDAAEQASIQNFPIIPDNEDARTATVNVTENLGVNYLDRSPRSAPTEHEYVDELNAIAENLPETARSTNKPTDVEIERSLGPGAEPMATIGSLTSLGEDRVLPLGKSPLSTFVGNETATCKKETFVRVSLGLAKSPGTCFTDLSPKSITNSEDGKEIGENVEPRLLHYAPEELDNHKYSLAALEKIYEEERAQASSINPASVLETTIIMENRKEPSTSESTFLMTADTFEFKDDSLNAVDTTALSEIVSENAGNANKDDDVEVEEGPNFSTINASARLAESESREISENIEEFPAEDQPLSISRETLAAAITDSSSKTYFQSEELNVHEGTFESFEQNFNVEETWTAPGPMQFLVEDLFHKDSEVANVANDIAHFRPQAQDEEKMDHGKYEDFWEIDTPEAPTVTKSHEAEDSQAGTKIHVESSGTMESIFEEAMTRTPTAANREEIKYAINDTEISGTKVTACSPSGINDVNKESMEEDYVQSTPAENSIFDSVNDDAIRNKESTVDSKSERSSKHNEYAAISNSKLEASRERP